MSGKIDAAALAMIEQALRRGERVELIPTRDGVKIMRVRREEIRKP